MTGFLDKLKDNDSEGSEMVEERPAYEESTPETDESDSELNTVAVSYTHLTLPTNREV